MAFRSVVFLSFLSMALKRASSLISSPAVKMRWTAATLAALLLPAASVHAQAIAASKSTTQTASPTLTNSLIPALKYSSDTGRLAPATPMKHMALHFALTTAQQADLTTLLHNLQDPNSPQYHRWLTSTEFQQRFGRAASDVATAEAWLKGQGFEIESVTSESIRFSGTVSQVESAFQTQIHNYKLGTRQYFANSTAVTLPKSLAGITRGIGHLNSLRPTPLHINKASKPTMQLSPNFTDSTGDHYMVPADVQAIYDVNPIYTAGYTGAGQTITVVGQSLVDPNDIALFHKSFGGNANLIMTLVPFTGDAAITTSDDEGESDLDIEYSGSIGANATVNFVFVGNDGSSDAFDAMQYAVQNQIGNIISISYGACEPLYGSLDQALYGFWMDVAVAQGQTLIAASGDAGATACDQGSSEAFQGLAVQFPSDSDDVTAVGGTEFNEGSNTSYWGSTNGATGGSATGYIPEMVWNDDATAPELAASGGGASTLYTKPDWQIGTGVPVDGARDVPDIALDSSSEHDSYFYCGAPDENGNNCADGYVYLAGGTSFAAPIFAGMTSLINQATASTGQGNINPTLYPLASSTPSVFHDITLGNNESPCISGSTDCTGGVTAIGYSATPGYDLTTGLGTVDALLLAQHFPNYGTGAAIAGSNTTASYSPSAPNAGSTITFTATVATTSTSATVSGNVQFLIDGVSSGPIALSGGTATYTNVIPLAAGPHILVAEYEGNSIVASSAGSALISVAALPPTSTVVTISPAAPTAGTPITVTTVTSSATPGTPTGTVDLSVDGNDTNNPVTMTKAQTTVTLPALSAGAHTITAQYSGDTSYSASEGVSSFTVLALSATTASVTVTPSSPSTTDSVTATAFVTTGATGTVQFLLDGKAAGSPVTVANGTAQYSLGNLAAGSHTVSIQYSGDTNFAAATGQQSFVVSSTAAAFTLAATNVTVGGDASASTTVTVASTSDYAGTVQLAVTGTGPTNSCFLVNNNPSVASHATATAIISIYTGGACSTVTTTTANAMHKIIASNTRPTPEPNSKPFSGSGLTSTTEVSLASLSAAGALLLGLCRRRSLIRWLVLLAAVSAIGILSGCGGSSSKSTASTTPASAPAGTYTLTVTGTDATTGSNTATTTFTLTIQ